MATSLMPQVPQFGCAAAPVRFGRLEKSQPSVIRFAGEAGDQVDLADARARQQVKRYLDALKNWKGKPSSANETFMRAVKDKLGVDKRHFTCWQLLSQLEIAPSSLEQDESLKEAAVRAAGPESDAVSAYAPGLKGKLQYWRDRAYVMAANANHPAIEQAAILAALVLAKLAS